MDESQIIYVSLLVAASLTGGPSKALLLVMWGNLGATMFLADNYTHVAAADIIAAVILTLRSRHEGAIALLFAAMLPVYVVADQLSFTKTATYAIIDALAYAQIVILGRWDGGFFNIGGNPDKRGATGRSLGSAARNGQIVARRDSAQG
jgi:hypothetical protein